MNYHWHQFENHSAAKISLQHHISNPFTNNTNFHVPGVNITTSDTSKSPYRFAFNVYWSIWWYMSEVEMIKCSWDTITDSCWKVWSRVFTCENNHEGVVLFIFFFFLHIWNSYDILESYSTLWNNNHNGHHGRSKKLVSSKRREFPLMTVWVNTWWCTRR